MTLFQNYSIMQTVLRQSPELCTVLEFNTEQFAPAITS